MFEYDVVPLAVTRGAGQAESGQEWDDLRAGLNERGSRGFRVVAVTDGPEGRAVIMEREVDAGEPQTQSITQAAEDITFASSRASQETPTTSQDARDSTQESYERPAT